MCLNYLFYKVTHATSHNKQVPVSIESGMARFTDTKYPGKDNQKNLF